MVDRTNRVYFGDCRDSMRQLISEGVKVQTCVTSPPYFGLRSYMPEGIKLRDNIPPDKLIAIINELQSMGIYPIVFRDMENLNGEYLQEKPNTRKPA